MERSFPQIDDRLEWNLVQRRSLTGTQQVGPRGKVFYAYATQSFLIDSYMVMVGCDNPKALSTWYLGMWATMLLPITPSYTTNYVSAVSAHRDIVRLGILNLLIFPKLIKPWILELKIPSWHELMNFEVWRYDGEDIDYHQRLADLETKIDAL